MCEWFQLDYENNVSVQFYISKKGYCYKVDNVLNKIKRISESEYMMSYEEYCNY